MDKKKFWQTAYEQSALGSFFDARTKLNNEDYEDEKEKKYLEGVRNNAVMSGLMSVGQGINGILNPALQAADIADTTMQRYDIANVANMGSSNYYDWNQIGADYANANMNVGGYEADDVRGMTTGEKWGSVGTGALAGAKAGYEVGGWVGALAGGVIGAGGALAGVISGNRKAQREAINLNNQADIAQQYAKQNFAAGFEQVADRQNRKLQSNIAAEGGKISQAAKSRHMTISQFADSVLAKQNADKYSDTIMKHKYSAGGKTYNTHGGYFAPDIVKIENGGTHEQNPFGGVQVGVDPMGVPNLVEEGEIIYDDYVFSDRLNASESLLKEFSLPEKYAGKSFAYIADRLSAEAKERSNDAISNNGMAAMYDRLMAAQDYHKEKLEMARMKRELNKLSPEEQQAVADAMFGLQPMPEQEAMPMQEPMPEQPMMEGMPVMAAHGGQLANLYRWGDRMIKKAQDEKVRKRLEQERLQRQRERAVAGWIGDSNNLLNQRFNNTPQWQYTFKNIYNGQNGIGVNTTSDVPSLLENSPEQSINFDGYRGIAGMIPNPAGPVRSNSTNAATVTSVGGSNGATRANYGSGRDKEYQVPYINFVDYMRGQVNDGVLSDNGKAMLSRIYGGNPDDYDINNFNDWLKNATDGIDGKIHDATLKVANDWSDSIATSRFDEPLPNLARPEDPYFNYTPSLMRDPEAEARVRQRQIENINNTPSEGGSAENNDFTPLPTWMRYAGVGYNLLSGLHNMFQEPDRYQYRRYTPDTVEGQLALDRLQYNPYDFNIANNQINANAAATNSALQNAGMGPSAGAALLAANYNNARNLGNSYWQTRLANQQQLANVTQANNQAAQAEADFDYRRNLANTQIRNQAALYNLQNAMQTDMWNKQAESQKWQAVSQSLDASAQDLANIGRENFNMNMANWNPALFYGLYPNGYGFYKG